MTAQTQNLKDIDGCASVAAYTLRALADALEACQANSSNTGCCGPQVKTEESV